LDSVLDIANISGASVVVINVRSTQWSVDASLDNIARIFGAWVLVITNNRRVDASLLVG
jgi:hypothetical protein